LIRSVSTVTIALANVSSVFQLFSFLVGCSNMILKGFGFVAFFASVKSSSVCIRLSCIVCIQSVVHGVWSRFFCGHKGCSLPEVSTTSFLPLQFFVSVRHKNVGKTKVLYIAVVLAQLRPLGQFQLRTNFVPVNPNTFSETPLTGDEDNCKTSACRSARNFDFMFVFAMSDSAQTSLLFHVFATSDSLQTSLLFHVFAT
jgi:hypothetical protein